MRLLVLNMAMDLDTPAKEFMVAWVRRLADHVDRVDVITMQAGRVEVPANVRLHSLGKELGYSKAEIAEIKGSGAITAPEKGARAEAA